MDGGDGATAPTVHGDGVDSESEVIRGEGSHDDGHGAPGVPVSPHIASRGAGSSRGAPKPDDAEVAALKQLVARALVAGGDAQAPGGVPGGRPSHAHSAVAAAAGSSGAASSGPSMRSVKLPPLPASPTRPTPSRQRHGGSGGGDGHGKSSRSGRRGARGTAADDGDAGPPRTNSLGIPMTVKGKRPKRAVYPAPAVSMQYGSTGALPTVGPDAQFASTAVAAAVSESMALYSSPYEEMEPGESNHRRRRPQTSKILDSIPV